LITTYPRLSTAVAMTMLGELNRVDTTSELTARSATSDPRAETYPTGIKKSEADLARLRSVVVDIAKQYGFPSTLAARGEAATLFDREVSVALLAEMDLLPADAGTEGVWSFLTLVLLPDVAFWRWPNPRGLSDYERLIGKPRNVFRRLWWRAYCLGSEASQHVFEDEAVAIMERPTIGGDPRLAQAIATNHLRMVAADSTIPRTELLRQVAKRVRRLSMVRTFAALEDDELVDLIQQSADDALAALRAERARTSGGHVDV
jgi:hypothetical protein